MLYGTFLLYITICQQFQNYLIVIKLFFGKQNLHFIFMSTYILIIETYEK